MTNFLEISGLGFKSDTPSDFDTLTVDTALTVTGTALFNGLATAAKGFAIGGNPATLAAGWNGPLFSYEAPTIRFYIGDGSGYSLTMSKRAISATTDLFKFDDYGNLTIKVGLLTISALPTSASGLPTGTLWNSSGVVHVA